MTITVAVDLVKDHVVDPVDLVDSVVDLTHLADSPVDLVVYPDPVLRSAEVFLLLTISVLCAVCASNACDDKMSWILIWQMIQSSCNLCLGCLSSSSDNCVSLCIVSFYAVDLWLVVM